MSDDYGKSWSEFVPAGSSPKATALTKPWIEYSRKGVLALMWRAIYPDRTYDIWSSVSRDGGHSFSASLRVSHAVSPDLNPYRNGGRFGDDIQNLAMDEKAVHFVWGDSRAGFLGVWYGRVALANYAGSAADSSLR